MSSQIYIFIEQFLSSSRITHCNNLYRNFVGNKSKPCNEGKKKKASLARDSKKILLGSSFPLSVHKINNPVFLNVLACATRRKEKFPEELGREVASATVKWYVYRENLIKSITPHFVPRAMPFASGVLLSRPTAARGISKCARNKGEGRAWISLRDRNRAGCRENWFVFVFEEERKHRGEKKKLIKFRVIVGEAKRFRDNCIFKLVIYETANKRRGKEMQKDGECLCTDRAPYSLHRRARAESSVSFRRYPFRAIHFQFNIVAFTTFASSPRIRLSSASGALAFSHRYRYYLKPHRVSPRREKDATGIGMRTIASYVQKREIRCSIVKMLAS